MCGRRNEKHSRSGNRRYDPRSADLYSWSPKPISTQLLSAIRDWAHREGYRSLWLMVTEDTAKTLGPDAEPDPYDATDTDDEELDDGEVGEERAGRLVDPDEGLGEDTEKDLVADDVGIDGAAASAEEAAVHIVPDQEGY